MKTNFRQRVAFAFSMGFITTGIISLTLIMINVGYTGQFWKSWLTSWAMAYVVVIPAILWIGPKIQLMVQKLIK